MEPDFVSATQYLPKLPKANLDDRSFEDLVEECLLRIPRYCPEWTNYNPGDPGVTLIELFAWLVHQMLYRFNQVPRRHYVAFLELLGIRLLPPAPARTEITFYLTQAQPVVQLIPAGAEVATVRTENQEAVVFTTDENLVIGQPVLKHLLFAGEAAETPERGDFNANRFDNTIYEQTQNWAELEIAVDLFSACQVGNCFYLVVEPAPAEGADSSDPTAQNRIEGNVLAFNFKGPAAVTTGINPNNPPLQWQAWDGTKWCDRILQTSLDDKTKGFSFDRLGEAGPNPEQEGADVILHLPHQWPQAEFGSYQGHWIRCIYTAPNAQVRQFGYERSPEITGIGLRAVGGVVTASECITIGEELIGVSDGKAGQVFERSRRPILARQASEHIRLRLPIGVTEDWQEVSDFGDSTVQDQHYIIDNSSGTLQFGPLIREPEHIQQQTHERSQLQSWGRPGRQAASNSSAAIPAVLEAADRYGERQYGRVPPMGSEIYMTGYRVGGGSRGNVQAGQLRVLKSSIPYVKQVTNYSLAEGGLEAESLDEAMIRVPALLRTRKTAISPEDFERTAKQFQTGGYVHRAHCITIPHLTTPGVVRLLIVPTIPQGQIDQGLHPDRLQLESLFAQDLRTHLDMHKALGIRATVEPPDYIGVSVQAEVYLLPQYRHPIDRERLSALLTTRLYQFLNPITGGIEQQGWPLGRSVQASDIIAQLQQIPEVHSVGQVQLLKSQRYRHRHQTGWMQLPTPMAKIDLGPVQTLTSWHEPGEISLASGHRILFLDL